MKKQKVLIIHNQYQIPGGEDTVVNNEKKLLEDNGHEVVLYIKNNNEISKMSKAKKVMVPLKFIYNARSYRDVKRIIREQYIDVVHVHNTLNLISPSVYYAAKDCNIPVVQTIHNFRLLCPGATFYRDEHICEDCVSKGLSCAIKNSCYRGSKVQTLACVMSTKFHRMRGIYGKLNYICLTEFNREKLTELKQIDAKKIYVKPNFVSANGVIQNYSVRKNQMVFAGRLDKLKGIGLLLNAWKILGSEAPELILCGTGPMEEWCKKFISNNSLTNVKMMGFVKNKDALKIIGESKALILPTQWYEGFPMTIVEAYSVGTPVIGSDIGNVGNIIKPGITGWKFEHESVDDLVEAVRGEKNIVDSVVEEYNNYYTAEKNYEKLVEIYNQILK